MSIYRVNKLSYQTPSLVCRINGPVWDKLFELNLSNKYCKILISKIATNFSPADSLLILSKSLPSQKTQTGLRLMKVCLHAKVVKLGYPKENSLFDWLGVLPSLFKDPGHTWDPVVSPQWLWSSSFQPHFFFLFLFCGEKYLFLKNLGLLYVW